MDREQIIRIVSDYARQVRSIINPIDIILFGSHVRGGATADSDIDVAVVFDKFEGDWRQTVQKLHELTISVDTRIEPILLESRNDPSGFVKTVRHVGLKVS